MRIPPFIRRTIAAIQDPEKAQHANQPQTIPTTTARDHRDARVEETLNSFRYYVGIHNDDELNSGRPFANVGIYQRLVQAEKNYNKQYKTYSTLINSALGLQIVFAAALTALGAGNGPKSAVTAFGAINTVIAGFLTYLKGSGLPNRLKYYENEMVKVREYIEQREREFARGSEELNLKEEVMIIEQMYEMVKRDVEINTPEAYVSISNMSARESRIPPPSLGSRQRSRFDLDGRPHDYDDKMNGQRRTFDSRLSLARSGAESKLSDMQRGMDSRFQDTRHGLEDRVNNISHGLQSQISQTRLGAESRMTDTREGLNSQYQYAREGAVGQLQRSRSEIENELQRSRAEASQQYDQTRSALENQYDQTRLATQAQLENTRHGIESRIQSTQAQVEGTRHDLETRLQDTQRNVSDQVEQTRHGLETRFQDTQRDVISQVEQTKYGMESKLQDVQDQMKQEMQGQMQEQEQKIVGMVESVASKVLSVTQKMHEKH